MANLNCGKEIVMNKFYYNKMKKILFMCLIALGMMFTSCGSMSLYHAESYINERFEPITNVGNKYSQMEGNAVYDKQTKVIYVVSRTGAFTVMVDKDGKPLLYEVGR
jgi:hypothetical protein